MTVKESDQIIESLLFATPDPLSQVLLNQVFDKPTPLLKEAVKRLNKIPEVIECHYTTGNWSILVKILSKNNEHLMNLLNNNIQKIPGISRTETFISLEQQISRQISI